jgi:hypothetical protein
LTLCINNCLLWAVLEPFLSKNIGENQVFAKTFFIGITH